LLHLLVYFNVFLITALSLNLIVGYAGLLTLAHAGYFAVGAYAYAILNLTLKYEFLAATLVGMGISAILSLAVSLCSWRLRGDFFILATLAVQALMFSSIYNWTSVNAPLGSLYNLTNGPFGITGIGRPRILGYEMSTLAAMAAFSTAISGICAFAIWRLIESPWGRVLIAIRDDELAAANIGKNTRWLKVVVIAIASAFVAIAGSLYAAHVRYVDPTIASLDQCTLMLSMVVVGGFGNFRGPFIGALVLILLPEILRAISLPDSVAASLRQLIYGLLLILMMLFRPQGIAGESEQNLFHTRKIKSP
jgi:branched-chain amino acid transport system permease protein